MTKFICYISFCLLTTLVFGQGEFLPIAKNGKWGLVNEQGFYVLKPKYDYIEYSQAAQKYLYHLKGKQGLIDAKGAKVLNQEYEEIKCLSLDFTAVRIGKKWQLLQLNKLVNEQNADSISLITENLFLFYHGLEASIYNSKTKSTFTGSFIAILPLEGNTLLVQHRTAIYSVLNNQDLTVLAQNITSYKALGKDYLCLNSADSSIVLNFKKPSILWKTQGKIQEINDTFVYSRSDTVSYLFNIRRKQAYTIPKVTHIHSVSNCQIRYEVNGLLGVWNYKISEAIVPAVYENIMQVGSFWYINHFNKNGIYSNTGKEVIPVQFDDIEEYNQCFKVEVDGLFGLYSLSGNEIEPVNYNDLRVYDNSAKCLKKESLTLLSFDDFGNLTDRKIFTDFMSINVQKPEQPRRRASDVSFDNNTPNDDRYVSRFGWYRPILKRFVKGDTVEYRGKWGLKNAEDSILLSPRYGTVRVIEALGFTKAYRTDISKILQRGKDLSYDLIGITKKQGALESVFDPAFVLIDHFTGKKVSKNIFIGLNHLDFSKNALARGYSGTPILANKMGEIIWEDLMFFSDYEAGIMSICQNGSIEFRRYNFKYEGEVVAPFIYGLGATSLQLKNNQQFMKIVGGSWYYINRVGKQLNTQPFQHGGRFKNGRAIVKINNKWGVIDTSMNYIIPADYDMVERVTIGDSAYFKIGLKTNENYLYNRVSGDLKTSQIEHFDQYYEGVWRCKLKGNNFWGLVDTNFQMVLDPVYTKIYHFNKNGIAQVVNRANRSLIDITGNTVIPYYKAKNIEQKEDLYIITTKKGVLLINNQLDTVIKERDCKEVLGVSDTYVYFLDKNKSKRILNRKSKQIINENWIIYAVSLPNHLALIKKGSKKRLLNLKTNKVLKIRVNDIVDVVDNVLVYRSSANRFGLMSLNRDSITQPIYKDIKIFENGWGIAKEHKYYQIITTTGKVNERVAIHRILPLGNAFKLLSGNGKGVLSAEGKILLEPTYADVELYNNKFYRVTDVNGKKLLFDLEGNRLTDIAYDDFKAVSVYGIVAEHDQFDYLYTEFLNKSLSFQRMTPFSGQLFMLNEGFKIGLMDARGEELLPVSYHKIEQSGHFWQIRFFNSFGFAKQNGTIINDPLVQNL